MAPHNGLTNLIRDGPPGSIFEWNGHTWTRTRFGRLFAAIHDSYTLCEQNPYKDSPWAHKVQQGYSIWWLWKHDKGRRIWLGVIEDGTYTAVEDLP